MRWSRFRIGDLNNLGYLGLIMSTLDRVPLNIKEWKQVVRSLTQDLFEWKIFTQKGLCLVTVYELFTLKRYALLSPNHVITHFRVFYHSKSCRGFNSFKEWKLTLSHLESMAWNAYSRNYGAEIHVKIGDLIYMHNYCSAELLCSNDAIK